MDNNMIDKFASFPEMIGSFRKLAQQYGDMPIENVVSAYSRAMRMSSMYSADPYIQNRRVKQIQSLPANHGKEDVANMILLPQNNERPLREVAHTLESTAYPMLKLRKTYQDILTYNHYAYPAYLTDEDAKSPELAREAMLVDKLNKKIDPRSNAHKISGQVIQEGKVFYTPRYSVDKSHNRVNFAFMQQLPSDWVKIVGFNNISGYTVAFDLMYLFEPGADWKQFGDLLEPYVNDFDSVLINTNETGTAYKNRGGIRRASDGKYVTLNFDTFTKNKASMAGSPDLYNQNGHWMYWVTLPPEKVWTFEVDDTNANVVTPLTGLFLAMQAIAQYEQIQIELVQNPLISVFTGEIPYITSKDGTTEEDKYSLSNASRMLFESLWYQMMSDNNTGGIAFYSGPFKDIRMHQLSEAPGATEISAKGYSYAMEKSGAAGLIPVNDNPRAGVVAFSAQLEGRYCQPIYWQFSKMMNYIYESLGLKYTWYFIMYGDISSDEKLKTTISKSMSLGILPDTFIYNALSGRSMIDDLSMSRFIVESGVMNMRLPLVSSYNASQEKSNLPPQNKAGGPGRPPANVEDGVSEGTEDDLDD